jgi:hypothetical protein
LDFETMSPAVPMYPETRPYERLPFQWSLHKRDKNGDLQHSGFLADGGVDPQPILPCIMQFRFIPKFRRF